MAGGAIGEAVPFTAEQISLTVGMPAGSPENRDARAGQDLPRYRLAQGVKRGLELF